MSFSAVRLVSFRSAAAALGVAAALVASTAAPLGAAPPEFLATVGPGYRELTTDGSRLWAARFGVLGSVRLVAEGGEAVQRAEITLPEACVRVAAAGDGTLYALALAPSGIEARVWERAFDAGAWTLIASFGSGDASFSFGGEVVPLADRVVLSLPRERWFGDGQSGPHGEGWVVVVDRVSASTTVVPQEVVGIRAHEGLLYGTRHESVPGGLSATAVKSADGGLGWTELPMEQAPLNTPFPPVLLGGPHAVGGDRLFWLSLFGDAVVVRREEGAPMVYALPDALTMDCRGMRIARGGESWIGFFRQRNAPVDSWDQETVSVSHRYLRDFESHPMSDLGHLDAAVLDDGFYLLRETVGGSALYRVPLPAERLPRGETPQLKIATGQKAFFSPPLGELVLRSTLEITAPGAAGVVYQFHTSTDLVNWEPLGLPLPAGTPEALLLDAAQPRRFFK